MERIIQRGPCKAAFWVACLDLISELPAEEVPVGEASPDVTLVHRELGTFSLWLSYSRRHGSLEFSEA